MNAAIVTLYGLNNYGNRLQNYAVSSTLLKLGVDCETLIPLQWSKTPYRQRIEQQVRELMSEDILLAQEQNPLVIRQFRYEDFNEAYIPERHVELIHFNDELASEYDFFVTGSDQVWNPSFRDSRGQIENRLLSFARPNQRVCFAPSIGMDELDAKWQDLFHRELNKYSYLNIREQSGAEIIKQLTGRNAEVVLDPTFMVNKDEWMSLARPLPGFDEEQPFILYYFLGNEEEEVPEEMRSLLDQAIEERGMKECRILDKNDPVIRAAGPSEFLYLFSKASLICTDSFHGTVFSILLGKPFLLCDRKLVIADKVIDMSNRTISLLQKLGLEHRLPGKMALTKENMWEADYTNAYQIIEKEQQRMNGLLKAAMRLE